MRKCLLSLALITGFLLSIGSIYAQDANQVTATCKDGTAFTGTKRSGACRGHGGVQSWGPAEAATIPTNAPAQLATPTPMKSARYSHPLRQQPGLGQYRQSRLPLPRDAMVREDQARHLHVRGTGPGPGRPPGPRKGLLLIGVSPKKPPRARREALGRRAANKADLTEFGHLPGYES